MPITAQFLKNIMTEARPIIERQMDDAKLIAGFRTVVANNGGDWGALKALIKAHIEDENDETGDGKRVQKILEKADSSTAYADMLGLANMNEKNFSDDQSSDPVAAKLVEQVAKGMQTAAGRAALVTALDVMIEREEAETNSPETATRLGQDVQSPRQCTSAPENLDVTAGETATNSETHQRPSNNDEPSPEAGPQAEASLAGTGTGTLAGREGRSEGEAASADLPTDFQPPAFLTKQKTIADYRPHCLHPEACGASGLNHCYRCAKAAGDVEAA